MLEGGIPRRIRKQFLPNEMTLRKQCHNEVIFLSYLHSGSSKSSSSSSKSSSKSSSFKGSLANSSLESARKKSILTFSLAKLVVEGSEVKAGLSRKAMTAQYLSPITLLYLPHLAISNSLSVKAAAPNSGCSEGGSGGGGGDCTAEDLN